jgi:type VI secretion system protein ImpH
VATQSRRTDPPLGHILFEEGHRFDFFQAVRVLGRLYGDRQPVGRDAHPSREVVRFRTRLSLDFPASAIHEIASAKDEDGHPEMTVAFMGLTGPLGALPRHYTELLIERVRQKDEVLRDFLDLFNHRLISFFFRAWEKYRFPIAYEQAVSRQDTYDRFSLSLFDLIGLGTEGLRGRLEVEDEALVYYAGLLGQRPRSASALENLLEDYFGVRVHVAQFIGQWFVLAPESRSRLGMPEANSALGTSAVAGNRVWDQQASFRIRIGPLNFAEFSRFLPDGRAFRLLVQLVDFVVDKEYQFDVQPLLEAAEVPPCRLGEAGERAPRLGWSTWLKTREFTHDAEDAIFAGRMSRTPNRSGSVDRQAL